MTKHNNPKSQCFDYFTAVEKPPSDGRKTCVYYLLNNRSGARLGRVKWYGPWHQFCFLPEPDSVWSDGCLADVGEVIAWAKQRRKERQ